MKPILVTNQSDWQRLAPVLERQGYVWSGRKYAASYLNPFNMSLIGKAITVYLEKGKTLAWNYNKYNKPTQSVEEYLLNDSLNELRKAACRKTGISEDTPAFVTTKYNHPHMFPETDYKAKYEALSKAVSEAEKVMMEYANTFSGQNMPEMSELLRNAMIRAIQILTEKTQGL